MSNSREITYICPYCGKAIKLEVWDVVSADDDEDLREKCISGDLFRCSCPHCHHEFMVEYPMIYIDRKHKFVLYCGENRPPEELMKTAEGLNHKGYTLRHTPTLKEFAEKIQVLEDNVDDRLVELAKYDSFIEVVQNRKAAPEDITGVEYQKTENDVMKINIRMGDKGMSFLIPVDGIREEMEQDIDRYKINNASFPEINTDWIISLFTENQKQA